MTEKPTNDPPKPTAREVYLKELSTNPRFQLAPSSGLTVTIIGGRPTK